MSDENVELLREGLKNYNIDCDDTMLRRFETYREILVDFNKHMNLTGITEQRQVYIKHFLDSVAIFKYGYFSGKLSVIDVGTGAGFPGLPLKIANPDIELTLLDSLNKRINFLKEVGDSIGFYDIDYVHGRAEDIGQNNLYREKFDIATARAVANLPILLELCVPFVRIGGFFICLKGPNVVKELEESENAINTLGVKLVEHIEVDLPDEELKHTILVFKKIEKTPGKYPRRPGKPSKNPL